MNDAAAAKDIVAKYVHDEEKLAKTFRLTATVSAIEEALGDMSGMVMNELLAAKAIVTKNSQVLSLTAEKKKAL
jgi:hypothetical protein